MKELAIFFRTMKLYAHAAHNLCGGPNFFADHEYLAELYQAYDDAYDSLIERVIGLYGTDSINLLDIQLTAADDLKKLSFGVSMNADFFETICKLEYNICKHIDLLMKVEGVTEGSKNLLAGLADDSEQRQYKIKQRIGK